MATAMVGQDEESAAEGEIRVDQYAPMTVPVLTTREVVVDGVGLDKVEAYIEDWCGWEELPLKRRSPAQLRFDLPEQGEPFDLQVELRAPGFSQLLVFKIRHLTPREAQQEEEARSAAAVSAVSRWLALLVHAAQGDNIVSEVPKALPPEVARSPASMGQVELMAKLAKPAIKKMAPPHVDLMREAIEGNAICSRAQVGMALCLFKGLEGWSGSGWAPSLPEAALPMPSDLEGSATVGEQALASMREDPVAYLGFAWSREGFARALYVGGQRVWAQAWKLRREPREQRDGRLIDVALVQDSRGQWTPLRMQDALRDAIDLAAEGGRVVSMHCDDFMAAHVARLGRRVLRAPEHGQGSLAHSQAWKKLRGLGGSDL